MIRVPLGDLKTAFANPKGYVRSFRPGGGGGPSKYSMFLHAIGEYHRTGDLAKAEAYLEQKLVANFSNVQRELPEYGGKLGIYVREFLRLGNTLVRYRDNISIPIPPQFQQFVVSGQAARVDLRLQGGYAVWMFVRSAPDWKDDPRMPLLQSAYAQKLGTPASDVVVGVYDFDLGQYATKQYTKGNVEEANKSLRSLLRLLSEK